MEEESCKITVKIIRSKRKTLAIKVNRDETVTVCAPLYLDTPKICGFLKEKEKWIRKKISEYHATNVLNSAYADFQQVLYLGESYNIVFANLSHAELNQNQKVLIFPRDLDPPAQRKELLRVFRRLAVGYLPQLVSEIGTSMGLCPAEIKVVKSKGRWGSCDSFRVIKLNLCLIHLPPECIRYVIIHELAHLCHLDHSIDFWALVARYDSRYKEHRKLLDSYAFLLKMY